MTHCILRFNVVWELGKIPSTWKQSVIFKTWKHPSDPLLTSQLGKTMERMIIETDLSLRKQTYQYSYKKIPIVCVCEKQKYNGDCFMHVVQEGCDQQTVGCEKRHMTCC